MQIGVTGIMTARGRRYIAIRLCDRFGAHAGWHRGSEDVAREWLDWSGPARFGL